MTKPMNTWEERLSKEYDDGCYRNDTALGDRRLRLWFKSFVASELQQQRREIVEMIEGMKKNIKEESNMNVSEKRPIMGEALAICYNQALDDIIKKVG